MIQLSDIKYNNEFRPTQDLKFLLGCIGEKITIDFSFYYEDITYATADNDIILNPDGALVDLADTTGVIYSSEGLAFTDTYPGDTIGYYTGGVYTFVTVLEKFDNGLIRTDYGGGNGILNPGDYIFNSTPFSGIRYAYNLIQTGGAYNSLVDGELQQLQTASADTENTSPVNMNFTGIKSYQIGGATIKGDGGVGGGGINGEFLQQKFTISHTTYITPIFLAYQYNDLQLGIKPEYFDAAECLNYIGRISMGRNLNDPNGLKEYELPILKSNTAWFNENFNGGGTNYTISSLVFKNADLDVVNSLSLDEAITVEMVIKNTVDSPFSNNNTKFVFGFNYLPEDESLYQNNGNNLKTNFLLDTKINTIGAGAVNGDYFGAGMQVIKNVTGQYINATEIKITATIELGAQAKAICQAGDLSRYAIWAITENHSLPAVTSDKVALISAGCISEFYTQKTATNIIQGEPKFIQHPYTNSVDAVNGYDLKLFPVDDIVAETKFFIDYNPSGGTAGQKTQFILYGALFLQVGQQKYQVVIGNDTIGTAAWEGSQSATLQKIVDSINTGTEFIPAFTGVGVGGLKPFNGSTGWTATFNTSPSLHAIIEAPTADPAFDTPAPIFCIKSSQSWALTLVQNGILGETFFPATGSKILSIENRLVLKASGESDVILERYKIDTINYPVIGGMAQDINFKADLGYKIPDEIRRNASIFRDYASDVNYEKHFINQYGFMHRMEYWENLILNTIPNSLFDSGEPNKGINHFWHRYTTLPYWNIYYDIVFTIEQNGIEFEQTLSEVLEDSTDFFGNPEWDNLSINTYDSSNNALFDGNRYFINGYEDTKVVASFEKVSGGIPVVSNVGIVIWIEVFETGGTKGVRRASSFYNLSDDPNTWFKNATDKVDVVKVGNVYTGTVYIDYTKLPKDVDFTMYARIYEFYIPGAKQFEDGNDFEFEDSILYEFE